MINLNQNSTLYLHFLRWLLTFATIIREWAVLEVFNEFLIVPESKYREF